MSEAVGRESAQRIDRWLCHARIVRTRADAADLVRAGYVRVNGVRVAGVTRTVHPGDIITVALDRGPRLLRVLGFAARRGSADEARGLVEDITKT
ncbi:RNA-binding S4 domain-containing protein [Blastochloris viridis]|uniref:Ribosome-associated heat shock protein Hsp15 n=1 Tax=Blastochloris viridis TaxID=1079 RepID=A0A0H5B9L1_BLAVI|nr:S4 domain-containing protein [Blastochloris viridis]ALK07857.1 ribosome-associated heat shock protein Hsp15 [Blastochloris viridis]BAR98897.1 ribosome-associated heat shock protein implicated in the recycling of the 50S subunit (S4 paralog) [Blastochloris viridis]CUU43779.1 ribosome-associated heat shock protein Hsp15 [Blastochloris viridis]